MSRKKGPLTAYLIAWPDGTIKAGVSSRRRWLSFRGDWTILHLVESDSAYEIEGQWDGVLSATGQPRFTGKHEAVDHLGGRGDGWAECFWLPMELHDACRTHCVTHAERIAGRNAEQNRREQKTENRLQSPLDQSSPKSTRATREAGRGQ
jgi:hypothetical protein